MQAQNNLSCTPLDFSLGGLALPNTVLPPYFHDSLRSCATSWSKLLLGWKSFSSLCAALCRFFMASLLSVLPSFARFTACSRVCMVSSYTFVGTGKGCPSL